MGIWNLNHESETEMEEAPAIQQESTDNEKSTKHFAVWTVGGESFRLKLRTTEIKVLEAKYKMNLISMVRGADSLPPVTVMLDVTFSAMKPWNHGLKEKDAEGLYQKYIDEGGDQISFFTDVFMEIFLVSGFFPKAVAEEMQTSLEEMRKEMQDDTKM